MKEETKSLLDEALAKAREKHPVFVNLQSNLVGASHHVALTILMEEVGEVAKALYEGKIRDARQEILDVMAVCVRIIEEV